MHLQATDGRTDATTMTTTHRSQGDSRMAMVRIVQAAFGLVLPLSGIASPIWPGRPASSTLALHLLRPPAAVSRAISVKRSCTVLERGSWAPVTNGSVCLSGAGVSDFSSLRHLPASRMVKERCLGRGQMPV